MRDLTTLPIFDRSHADCSSCELQPQCDRGQSCHAYRPKRFNEIMVIGEGPGQREVAEGRPFVGVSGQTLRGIMSSVGIDLDECFVSNATLGKPPPKGEKGLLEAFPKAVPSCLSRLEAEIAAVRPRVIVTLGAAALAAVTGYDKEITRQVHFDCTHCNPETRKVGPVLECNAPVPDPSTDGSTAVRCGQLHFLRGATPDEVDSNEVELLRAKGCQKCGAKLKRVQPKMVKCPACQGRKTKSITESYFTHDHKLKAVAGAIFEPATNGAPPKMHELNAAFAEWGIAYFVPTYHPAFLLRDQQFMAKAVQHHLARAKRLVTEDVDLDTLRYEVTKDPERVRAFTETANGKESPVFTVDIETEAINAQGEPVDATEIKNVTKIKCVGIGTWARGCLVVDTRDVDPANSDDALLNALQDFLESNTPKNYHNGLYDIPVMARTWWLDEKKLIASYSDDTLGAHALLYPDEPHDLQHVTLDLVDARAWKPPKRVKHQEVHANFEALCEYNARDVLNTDAAREAMGVARSKADPGGRVARAKLGECYALDSKVRRIAIEMTLAGVPVDRERWRGVGAEADREVEEATARCKALLRDHTRIDPESFKPFAVRQVGEILFSDTGFMLPATGFTATNQYATDAKTLRQLREAERTNNPDGAAFIDALLALREAHKTRSTYVYSDAMQPWEDGRIHPVWKPWGTRTGRFSSAPNCQNWPGWLRKVVAAATGRVFVGADFDQLELRIMAGLSGDPEMIRRCMAADDKRKLEPDFDIHSFVGGHAFRELYTGLLLKDPAHAPTDARCPCQTCKRKALRDLVKRVVYGLAYLSGDQTIVEAIYSTGAYNGPPVTLEMVAHIRKTIFRAFPKLAEWRTDTIDRAKEAGEIRSALYYRRRIFPLDEVAATEVVNFPIQSSAADIVNERTVLLRERLAAVDPSAFLFAQVHDALYVECAEDRGPAIAQLLTDTLTCEKVLKPGAPAMRFTAAGVVSKNWKDAA